MVYLFYTTYISVDLAHHEVFRAIVGNGGLEIASEPSIRVCVCVCVCVLATYAISS